MLAITTTMLVAGAYGSPTEHAECKEESFMKSCLSQFIEADVCDKAIDAALTGGDSEETVAEVLGEEILASGKVDDACFLCDDIGDKIVEKCQFVENHPECIEETFIKGCMSQFTEADVCDKVLDAAEAGDKSDSAFEELAMEILASGAIDAKCLVCEDMKDRFVDKCKADRIIEGAIVAVTGANVGMIVGIILGVLALISCITCIICLCPICCVAAATVKVTGDQRV